MVREKEKGQVECVRVKVQCTSTTLIHNLSSHLKMTFSVEEDNGRSGYCPLGGSRTFQGTMAVTSNKIKKARRTQSGSTKTLREQHINWARVECVSHAFSTTIVAAEFSSRLINWQLKPGFSVCRKVPFDQAWPDTSLTLTHIVSSLGNHSDKRQSISTQYFVVLQTIATAAQALI